MRELKCGYKTKYEWPQDVFIQGDDLGVVISENSYLTSFFEAFPKNPSTFIRGEGVDLEEAEEKAWTHYQNILNCEQHDFVRQDETNHGNCSKCNLFQSNIFESIKHCACCNKPSVYLYSASNKSYYCLKDFLLLFKEESYNLDENTILKLLSDRIVEFKYDYERFLKLNTALSLGLISIHDSERTISAFIEDKEFINYKHNILIHILKEFDEYSFSILSHSYLKKSIFFNKDLYSNLYESFITKKDIDKNLLISHINKFVYLFDEYFILKYGNDFNRLIKIIK